MWNSGNITHSAESDPNFRFVPVYQNWCIFRKSHQLVLDAIFPKKFDSGNYRSGESKGESLGRHVLRVHGNFSQKSHIRAEGGSNSESNGESFVCFTKKTFPHLSDYMWWVKWWVICILWAICSEKNDENRVETSEKDVKMTPDDSPYDSPFFIIVKYDTRPF